MKIKIWQAKHGESLREVNNKLPRTLERLNKSDVIQGIYTEQGDSLKNYPLLEKLCAEYQPKNKC